MPLVRGHPCPPRLRRESLVAIRLPRIVGLADDGIHGNAGPLTAPSDASDQAQFGQPGNRPCDRSAVNPTASGKVGPASAGKPVPGISPQGQPDGQFSTGQPGHCPIDESVDHRESLPDGTSSGRPLRLALAAPAIALRGAARSGRPGRRLLLLRVLQRVGQPLAVVKPRHWVIAHRQPLRRRCHRRGLLPATTGQSRRPACPCWRPAASVRRHRIASGAC